MGARDPEARRGTVSRARRSCCSRCSRSSRRSRSRATIEPTPTRWWLRRDLRGRCSCCCSSRRCCRSSTARWRLTIGGVRLRVDRPRRQAADAGAVVALVGWMSIAAARAWRRRGGARRSPFYALAAFAMWVFALGPDPTFFGMRALYQAPYGWLMRLPGFDGLRVPARFWMMCLACLSVLAALADQPPERTRAAGGRRDRRRRTGAGRLAEAYSRSTPRPSAGRRRRASTRASTCR